jgi:hypothetical protein
LKFFTNLSAEALVDCVTGPLEQLGVPCWAVIESDRRNSAENVVWSKGISQICRQTLPQWVIAASRLRPVGRDKDALDRAGEAVVVAQYKIRTYLINAFGRFAVVGITSELPVMLQSYSKRELAPTLLAKLSLQKQNTSRAATF